MLPLLSVDLLLKENSLMRGDTGGERGPSESRGDREILAGGRDSKSSSISARGDSSTSSIDMTGMISDSFAFGKSCLKGVM